MTDANPSRFSAQDARQALSEELDRHLIASMHRRDATFMTDQDKSWRAEGAPPYMKPNGQVDRARINAALAQYEEARMGPRPKPKFELHLINHDHFYAKRSRAGLIDVVFVAIAVASWLGLLFSIYLVFK